ncbi:hypothetical protein NY537_14700 [Curtobacterium flaccumfaciens pv. betae]|uniref:hypothetical protein n=1 Tax=Curtobacterium flaccumfaciens TaxID=2035 RepID=UPI00265A4372|nr:hypothetical protein [Curtobacterium flaccumfaciens]MCS5513990.1 hypothetical protein [Curtobacterium flaccumfaciens pv. betae]
MTNLTVHFDNGSTHLSGQIEAESLPDYVWVKVEGMHPYWVRHNIWEGGSADGHYREFNGAEFPADSPVCTDVR